MNSRVKELVQRINKNPEDSFSKFALALELLKKDDYNKARILFEDILERDPDYVGVYYHLAALYENLGRIEQALDTYEKGIRTAEKEGNQHAKSELVSALTYLKMSLEE